MMFFNKKEKETYIKISSSPSNDCYYIEYYKNGELYLQRFAKDGELGDIVEDVAKKRKLITPKEDTNG